MKLRVILIFLIYSIIYIPTGNSQNKTYALIIGISKYQTTEIPPLRFADRDALIFNEYLRESGVDSVNIVLLTNEEAKYGNVSMALDDICINKAKKGDKVYFYFSGHGDVESRIITNDAYLLLYDSNPVVYSTFAISVRTIQGYIATLSSKGVQAVLITDACHSGKLAGGIDGMHNVPKVHKDVWEDEVKILSCQPGEVSLEGIEWGNGRGAFSYALINGMAGEANIDTNQIVDQRELEIYLKTEVLKLTEFAQNPLVEGRMQTEISAVNTSYLHRMKTEDKQAFLKIEPKGIVNEENHIQDSVSYNYRMFNEFLERGILVEPEPKTSAYYYYKLLPENESSRLKHTLARRNLSIALIDHMNTGISSLVDNKKIIFSMAAFRTFLNEANALRDMLGDKKLRELGLLSKVIFTQCLVSLLSKENDETKSLALHKLDTCLIVDNHSSLAYYMLAQTYLFNESSTCN